MGNSNALAMTALAFGGVLAFQSSASAAITFVGPYVDSGTGFGNVLNVLTVQQNGSEWGSILRSGGSDVMAGDAKNTSSTRTVAEMAALGVNANNLGIVFNINEPGSADMVTIQTFTLRFYHTNETAFFDLTWTGPLTLAPVNQGTGGAGYAFSVGLTAGQAALFFGDSSNRIGMLVPEGSPILDTFDGPENFYLIPSAGSYAMIGLGMFAMARRRR